MTEFELEEMTYEQVAALIQGSADGNPGTPTRIEVDSILDRHRVHDGMAHTALAQTIER